MSQPSRRLIKALDELRREYRFEHSKARPSPYASRLKGRAVAVILDAEVAAAFPTSESVNTALRAVMAPVRRRSVSRKPLGSRSGRSTKATSSRRSR